MLPIFLEDDELKLREPEIEDAEKFIEILHNKNVNKYLTRRNFPISLEEEEKWIEDSKKKIREGKALHLTMVLQEDEDKKVIGECGATGLDRERRSPELGIFIEEAEWDNGYGKRAMNLLINHVFNNFESIGRLSSAAIEYNVPSLALHRTLGFTKEGRRRGEVFHQGKKYDLIEFGIFRKEWFNNKSPGN